MKKILFATAALAFTLGVNGSVLADSGGPAALTDCNLNGLLNLAAHAGPDKALQVLINRQTNAGKGNGGEFALLVPGVGPLCGTVATEDNSAFQNLTDPGNSGEHNQVPD
jgi:hypothetical protein